MFICNEIQKIKESQEEIHVFYSVFTKVKNIAWCLFVLLRGGYFWGSMYSIPTIVQDARDRVASLFDKTFGTLTKQSLRELSRVQYWFNRALLTESERHWWGGEGGCSFSSTSLLQPGAFYCDASVTRNCGVLPKVQALKAWIMAK